MSDRTTKPPGASTPLADPHMPRIQYLSQAGIYHYHELGVPTQITWLDDEARDRLRHDSRLPAGGSRGWLLPETAPKRAIVMNKRHNAPGRQGLPAMTSGAIDLTIDESSDDEDVQFVKTIERQPVSKGSHSKKTTMSSSGRYASSSARKIPAALSPLNNVSNAPIDLRSDTSSPRGSKSRHAERVGDSNLPRTKLVAKKSAISGPPPHMAGTSPAVLDTIRSDGESLPDLKSKISPAATSSAQRQNSGPKLSFTGTSSTLKRGLDAGSGSSPSGQPSKKARLDTSNVTLGARSGGSSHRAKTNSLQSGTRKKLLEALSREASYTSRQDQTVPPTQDDRSSSLSAKRGNVSHQPSSPLRGQKSSIASTLPRRNPLADLKASQEKRSARQQSGSQDDTHQSCTGSDGSSPVAQSKVIETRLSQQPRSSPGTTKDAGKTLSSKEGGKQTNEKQSIKMSTVRPSMNRGESFGRPDQEERHSGPMRAQELLTQPPEKSAEPRSRAKEMGSSEDDQGYVSQSSGSAEERRRRVEQEDPGAGPASASQQSAGFPSLLSGTSRQGELLQAQLSSAERGKTSANQLESGTELQEENDGMPDNVTKSIEATEQAVSGDTSVPEATTRKVEHVFSLRMDALRSSAIALKKNQSGSLPPNTKAHSPDETPPTQFEAATEAAEADDQLQSEALRAQSDSVFAVPQSAASALKSSAAYAKLPLASKVEKVLGQYLEELAEDNEYWTSTSLMRARISKEAESSSQAEQEEATSFRHLKPLKLSPWQKSDDPGSTWGIEKMTNGKPVRSEKFTVPRKSLTSDTRDMPSYAHYVSITNNILAQNTTTLHCWPYFGDDFDNNQADNLREQYHFDIDNREQKLLRLRQAQKYEDYVESALTDLDCSWADVLRFLLEPRPAVGINPDAMKALDNRNEFCKEDFDRYSKRWVAVLSSLPPSNAERLARAAVLCENFQKLARFPLWHIARRSNLCKLPDNLQIPGGISVASAELTCRICLRFACPYHGEISERPRDDDDGDESDSSCSSVVATDLVHPPKVNYQTRVAFPAPQPSFEEADRPPLAALKKDPRYWQGFESKAEDRGPFYPCSHPGKPCDDEDADCRCFAHNLPCEKFCGCDNECNRKFQGCSCRIKNVERGVCFRDGGCTCYMLGRECDADLCGGCGVCEVVDPVNKHDEHISRGRCQNAGVQRGMPKCTLLGDSGVHGLGLYACENIVENEFVGEYKGEIITKEEAERRGAVYEHQRLSYLFSLNKDQEIDSTYFGNKIRFINHAGGAKANLFPRIVSVNTVYRIALYAQRSIKKGEELLFDYGPKFPDEQLGGKKSKKSAPHVRNANLVREFYDVEEDEDELGNVRAKGVKGRLPGRKGKQPKPKGGARPGAGRKPGQKATDQHSAAPDELRQPREESPFEDEFTSQDAGERLAAYNVADDRASDLMEVEFDPWVGAEDDDDEYHESEEDGIEASEESEESESVEDAGAEVDGVLKRRPGRPPGRRSWRT